MALLPLNVAMESLRSRFPRAFDAPECVAQPPQEIAVIESCAIHGAWRRDRMGDDGTMRYLPCCPQCAAEARAQSLVDRSAIPKRFQGKKLLDFRDETPAQKEALQAAFAYAHEFAAARERGTCLLFLGGPGTGKTHLACGIAQHVMAGGHSAMYCTVQDIIRAVRETWRADSERSERHALAAFNRMDLLVIDEVGVQAGSEDEQRILYGVIGARHANLRPMILMSNLPATAQPPQRSIKDYLGARLFDRLHEGDGKTVIFDWASYRRRAA